MEGRSEGLLHLISANTAISDHCNRATIINPSPSQPCNAPKSTSQHPLTPHPSPLPRLEGVGTGVSPLQGTKVVIQNLQTSVTQVLPQFTSTKLHVLTPGSSPLAPLLIPHPSLQEDIIELFGDIGALRRAKLVAPGHAEVTFINKADATRCCGVLVVWLV